LRRVRHGRQKHCFESAILHARVTRWYTTPEAWNQMSVIRAPRWH